MTDEHGLLEKTIHRALTGRGAHVEPTRALEELGWEQAGAKPETAPYTVFELIHHLAYWQDWVLDWLDGKNPTVPEHASESWPDRPAPESKEDWERVTGRFLGGIEALQDRATAPELLTERGEDSPINAVLTLIAHNSYHLGQVVFLRQMIGVWPPAAGGLTW